jgi:phage baseplate assembly protein W
MSVGIPHFALPFRFVGGAAAVVDQDTEEEIGQCVEVLVSTPVGSREEDLPEYGIADPTFDTDLDTGAILDALEEWEPRAVVTLTDDDDALDELVRRAELTVGVEVGD